MRPVLNKKSLMALFTLLLGLSGCDKYSPYTIGILNNSSDTICVYYTGQTARTNRTDSIIVLPESRNVYYNAEVITMTIKNLTCDPEIAETEVSVKTSSNRILSKLIWDKSNWTCDTDKKNSYYRMTFEISESDLTLMPQ